MGGQNVYIVASQGTSQWDQACIEIPETKIWSQAAFSNQNWDTMECPATDGSEGTWSCTIYFQKIFLTSDDSGRKRNIKDLRKVTVHLCNPRLGESGGALKIFLKKKKYWTYFECLVRHCREKYCIWALLRRKNLCPVNNKALFSQVIHSLMKGGLEITTTSIPFNYKFTPQFRSLLH